MLEPSVRSFMKKNEKRPQLRESSKVQPRIDEIKKGQEEMQWKMRQLTYATQNKNTDAVAASFDNKYFPEWKENKCVQINQMKAQVERLKATSESLKAPRPSDSSRPTPIQLQDMSRRPIPQKPTANVATFQFSSEKKLQSTSKALRSQKKETQADVYLADYKSQLAAKRDQERQLPLAQSTCWANQHNKFSVRSSQTAGMQGSATIAFTSPVKRQQPASTAMRYESTLLQTAGPHSTKAPIISFDHRSGLIQSVNGATQANSASLRGSVSIRPTFTKKIQRRCSNHLTTMQTIDRASKNSETVHAGRNSNLVL